MNGLFFGNTATAGGVDPRYPRFLMDTFKFDNLSTCYVLLSDLVVDDTTEIARLNFTISCETKANIKSRKQILLYQSSPYVETEIMTMTAKDIEGFMTEQRILLILNSYTYEPTTFLGNGICNIDILNLFPNIQSDFFDDQIYLVDSTFGTVQFGPGEGKYGGMAKNAVNLNLKLNGTVVDIKPKKSGELTGYIYIANPTKQKLLTIAYTINN